MCGWFSFFLVVVLRSDLYGMIERSNTLRNNVTGIQKHVFFIKNQRFHFVSFAIIFRQRFFPNILLTKC